uniref:Coenzyme Q-binding protein COQ10 START domain-containing protein n=1 Tax=Physcomitrium patens TaxID=3218 RepID=A0A7I4B4E7_PHYPA
MWVAHPTPVSHSVWRSKPCPHRLVLANDVTGTGNPAEGLRSRGGRDKEQGNLGLGVRMAVLSGEISASCCRDATLCRNSRINFQGNYIFLVPVSTRFSFGSVGPPVRHLNFRLTLQQGGNRLSGLKACLASASDGPVDGAEEEVPANSLEFTHKVALDVLAPPDLVWKLWTDIKSAPLWMRWIDRVDFLDEDASTDSSHDLPPGLCQLSRWTCSTIGFEVVWVARVEFVESNSPVRVLRWTTVEGLTNRGEVTFKENNTKGTTVELSVSASVVSWL